MQDIIGYSIGTVKSQKGVSEGKEILEKIEITIFKIKPILVSSTTPLIILFYKFNKR